MYAVCVLLGRFSFTSCPEDKPENEKTSYQNEGNSLQRQLSPQHWSAMNGLYSCLALMTTRILGRDATECKSTVRSNISLIEPARKRHIETDEYFSTLCIALLLLVLQR